MQSVIDALRDIWHSLNENQNTILILAAIAFAISVIVKILYKVSNKRQEIQYEKSLERLSIERRLAQGDSLQNKVTDYIIKFIVIAAVIVLVVFALDYVAGLIWED